MNWLKQAFTRRRAYDDLSEEIRGHLEERIEELVEGGMAREEASATARREFGNIGLIEEKGREVWRWPRMENLLQDARYGLRQFRRNPGFTAVAVLTLALGIGANTAIFSVLNSMLLAQLPVPHPEELVLLTNPDMRGFEVGFGDGDRDLLTYPEFQELARQNQVCSGMLAASGDSLEVDVKMEEQGANGEGAPAKISLVSGSYFSVLGVAAATGRTFTTGVDAPRDANPVAVISYSFWRDRLGSKPDVLGRKVRLRGTAFDIIGIMPRGFQGETVGVSPDIWVPLSMQAEVIPGRDYLSLETKPFHKTEWLQVMGRLKPGITLGQAQAGINLSFQQNLQAQTEGMSSDQRKTFLNQRIALKPGGRGASELRAEFKKPLLLLLGMVGVLLLIACTNVANLLLARASARQREMAVRVSIGAGAGRVFRQLLTESVLLALMGGLVGLVLAYWADVGLLRLASGGHSPIPLDVHPDARILGFTLAVSICTGILFGLAPALRVARVDLQAILKSSARGVIGGTRKGVRFPAGKVLVAAQVALSLVLLVVAGLFLRSFQKLAGVQLGYDRDHLLQFGLNPTASGYRGAAVAGLYKDVLQRIGAIPGVQGVSLSNNGIFYGSDSSSPVAIEGKTSSSGEEPDSRWDEVGPNFFSTLGIPVLEGREIGPGDGGNGQRVGLINQTMARYYFKENDPIGKRITVKTTSGSGDFQVVGVVADSKHGSVREVPRRRFYVPYFNPIGEQTGYAVIQVRIRGALSGVAPALREAVQQAAGNLPSIKLTTMNELVGASLTTDRVVTQLSIVFGVLAALLACIGIYGILAYSVAGRTNEIGVRLALGAQPTRVLRMILGETLALVLLGLAAGLPGIVAAGKLVSSELYQVSPRDPVAVGLASLVILLAAAAAVCIPARRAMRVDPMTALRYE